MKIPQTGLQKEALLERLESYRENDMPWREGRTFGYVFDPGKEVDAIAKEAYTRFLSENALDPTVFPSLLRFENEVISMARDHLRGDEDVVGAFSSGGTESIILSVKTARDYCRATRPHIKTPKMVLPVTAHAAFHKAAAYLDVQPVIVPVNPDTFRVDVAAMEAAIDEDTILLVASAPSYAHGVVDPVPELGALAESKGLLFHVDACIGGFLLPYFERLGAKFPRFDFSVPGVTSISMDLHKYAYCPKGASVLLHRSAKLRRAQIFACAEWSGYTVVNTTVQSSKSGGPLAAAWAVLNFVGDDGYLEYARGLKTATDTVVAGIQKMTDLRVLGRPDMSLVAFTSETINPFVLADEMKSRGWYIQAQLSQDNSPANIHLSINPSNVPWANELLKDLADSVEAARSVVVQEMSGLGQMFSSGDLVLTEETFAQILQMAGIDGVGLPGKMAEINQILDALPSKIRGELLKEYVNRLFVPAE